MNEINFSDLCHFTDKQWLATEAADTHQYTLFGGARGPGKSYWLRWALVRLLLRWAAQGIPNVGVMLGCEDYPSLKDRQISKIATEFPGWLGVLRETKERGLGFHLRPRYGGGSILLRNMDDPAKYQSAEFAAIAIDEVTQNPERTFQILRGSMRWPGIEDVKFLGATNPDPGWVRDYWVESRLPPEMAGLESQFSFVPGLADDNPYLPSGYWDMLDTLPGALRQAWRWGDWYAMVEGLVYSSFTADNITDMEPDPERPIELAVDDGYVDPRAVLFIQRTGKHILVYDEIYESHKLEEESIRAIILKCIEHDGADVPQDDLDCKALAAQAQKAGVRLPEIAAVSHEAVALRRRLRAADIPARNWMASKEGAGKGSVRVEAIKLTRSLICDGRKQRTILIHRRCKNLLEEITTGYKYPEGKRGLNEKPADGNDHACQALESWCWLRARR